MARAGESMEEIGERIRDLRMAMGYTNASLFAKWVGWTPQQLSNYERGTKRPEVTMATTLCIKTGVTLDWIFRGERSGLPLHVAELISNYQDRQRVEARA
jgi:transcriptional regulator with XRE-family HTH domain